MNVELYPHAPSAKINGTSEEAARSMDGKAQTLRAEVLKVMLKTHAPRGWTADEMATWLGETVLSIRPRFSELKALGKIYDRGERRKNSSGRNAVVWHATQPGEQLVMDIV